MVAWAVTAQSLDSAVPSLLDSHHTHMLTHENDHLLAPSSQQVPMK